MTVFLIDINRLFFTLVKSGCNISTQPIHQISVLFKAFFAELVVVEIPTLLRVIFRLNSIVTPCSAVSLAQISQNLTLKRFGKVIQMYIPLYLSNECDNSVLLRL